MQAAMPFSRWRHIQIRTENLNLVFRSEFLSENPKNQIHLTVKVILWSFSSHYLNPYSTSHNFLRAELRKTASNKFKVHVTKKLVNFSWIRLHISYQWRSFFKSYDHGISRIRCLFIQGQTRSSFTVFWLVESSTWVVEGAIELTSIRK